MADFLPTVDDDTAAAEPLAADVTAVLVAHDGARWLPLALDFLRRQTRPPDRVIAVNTGSTDSTGELLAEALGAENVIELERDAGFGAAVAAGLAHLGASDSDDDEFVWILHDDCAPAPDALHELLVALAASPSITVAGPKVLAWHDRHWLLEVGLTATWLGRRETGLERHEQDQGQHDAERDVLAVGSPGMLVRRDVWDRLGGFDPNLRLFGDDLDLGWRANLAGERVTVVPRAVVFHAEAMAHGRRRPDAAATGRHSDASRHIAQRRAALYAAAVRAPAWQFPLQLVGILVSSLLRVIGYVVAKEPGLAADEFRATVGFYGQLGSVWRARGSARAIRVTPERELRHLKPPPGVGLRHAWDAASGALAERARVADVDVDLDLDSEKRDSLLRRATARPGWLLAGFGLVAAILAGRGLIGGGWLSGGALLPATPGAADLWSGYLEAWHPVADGSALPAPPAYAVLATVAALALGSVAVTLDVLVLFAIPLSALSAYAVLPRFGVGRIGRVWGAAAYALLPAATGAQASGRIGSLVLLVLLPPLAAAALPVVRDGGTWRRVAATGLLLSVVVAFVPVLWPMAVLVLLVGGLGGRRDREAWARRAGFAAIPLVLLMPWSLWLLRHPQWVLLDLGAPAAALSPATPAWRVLLLDPGGPGSTPLPVGAVLVLGALVALLRWRHAVVIGWAWAVALVGLAAALLASVVTVQPPTASAAVLGWAGPGLVVAGAGLIVATALGAEGAEKRLREVGFSWRQPVAAAVLGLGLLAPVAAATGWIWIGAADPLQRGPAESVPAFVAADVSETAGARTLLIAASGSTETGATAPWALLRGSGARLSDAERSTPATAAATEDLTSLVSDLLGGQPRGGESERLRAHGVRYVQLTAPVAAWAEQRLAQTAGLSRVSGATGVAVWRLDGEPVVATVIAADGTRTPLVGDPVAGPIVVPPGAAERRVEIAEAAADGWSATLSGEQLARAESQWAQSFALPEEGGSLRVEYSDNRGWWLLAQALALAGIVLGALPGRRPDPDADAVADEADPTLAKGAGS
jgi:GT2 family glycosyltransferase